jgi:hypothetical protein
VLGDAPENRKKIPENAMKAAPTTADARGFAANAG